MSCPIKYKSRSSKEELYPKDYCKEGGSTIVTGRTLWPKDQQASQELAKGPFFHIEDTKSSERGNGMKGWCEQIEESKNVSPRGQLSLRRVCLLAQAEAGSKFRNLGEGESLKQSLTAKYFAPVVQWTLVVRLIIYELSNGSLEGLCPVLS